jgi:hypothetical protein
VHKAGIVNRLAVVHGYRHYLELCTRSTGPRDGMEVDYLSSDLDISECLDAIRRDNLIFDIALIDPFHEYGTSWRDLDEGFRLIRAGGTLVVHDKRAVRRGMRSMLGLPHEQSR